MRFLVFALIVFASARAWATAQIPEVIELEGKQKALFSEPLAPYFSTHKTEIPKLERLAESGCSAAWRGYQGVWLIRDDKFYLKSLFANPCHKSPDPIPLSTFFPGSKDPIHAEWYSGKLIVPLGKQIQYVHKGYESKYEQYLVILVTEGRVISREVTSKMPTSATATEIRP
jgi:hypothetical protein